MNECGKLKKVIGNKFLFPVILEQCDLLNIENEGPKYKVILCWLWVLLLF
jgi:hypothetical protein